tara:strand:+ start:722 stop:949 length:228 start_codon:yes stop_codon:yes gene_type:complete
MKPTFVLKNYYAKMSGWLSKFWFHSYHFKDNLQIISYFCLMWPLILFTWRTLFLTQVSSTVSCPKLFEKRAEKPE